MKDKIIEVIRQIVDEPGWQIVSDFRTSTKSCFTLLKSIRNLVGDTHCHTVLERITPDG